MHNQQSNWTAKRKVIGMQFYILCHYMYFDFNFNFNFVLLLLHTANVCDKIVRSYYSYSHTVPYQYYMSSKPLSMNNLRHCNKPDQDFFLMIPKRMLSSSFFSRNRSISMSFCLLFMSFDTGCESSMIPIVMLQSYSENMAFRWPINQCVWSFE